MPIVYGHPTHETAHQAERGWLALGGCMVGDDDDEWSCNGCEMMFGPPSSLDAAGGPVEAFTDAIARYFASWSITLPDAAKALRLPGAISDRGGRSDGCWAGARTDASISVPIRATA